MQTLLCEQHASGILTITLNRPDKLNTLTLKLLDELQDVLEQSQADPAVKALVITGAGKAFCAGADIQRLAELDGQSGIEFAEHGQAVFNTLEKLGKPSIAAINGIACGGGCELAMAASLRIAAAHVKFGQPEVKLGVIPGYGGTQRLPRLIGKGRALEMCLTGKFIDAKQAFEWGLVNAVSTADEVLADAYAFVEDILQNAPVAITSTMQLIEAGYDLPFNEALQLEAAHFGLCCESLDKQEGVDAFLSKRTPTFTGQ